MKNKTVNWGIIGPGRIARKFAQALSSIGNANLYAVASNDKDRAQNFASEFGAARSYDSYNELINDDKVEAIYIATPHRFHAEQCHLAFDGGKHVLCEKPLTVNASEAKPLFEKAKKNNLFFMEALWTRHLPIYKDVVKVWLEKKLIGDIKLLNSTFGFNFEFNEMDRKFNHSLAGGSLLDLGIYNIAVSQWVLEKEPINIGAIGQLGKTNVDEIVAANLNYGNGTISQFSCNFLSENENNFTIYGTEGKIKIHKMFWGATKATLFTENNELTVEKPFNENGFEYQVEEAMNCIFNGKLESPIMTHAQTLSNTEVMDNIREQLGLKYNFE